MKFCTGCNNMYYIQISEDNGNNIIYYCRNCGNKDTTLVEEGVCVLNTQFKKETQNFNHIINKYTSSYGAEFPDEFADLKRNKK